MTPRPLEPRDICRFNYTDPANQNRHCAIGWIREFTSSWKDDKFEDYINRLSRFLDFLAKNNNALVHGIASWNDRTPPTEVADTLNRFFKLEGVLP